MPMHFSNLFVSWQDVPEGNNPEGFRNAEFVPLAKELAYTVNIKPILIGSSSKNFPIM